MTIRMLTPHEAAAAELYGMRVEYKKVPFRSLLTNNKESESMSTDVDPAMVDALENHDIDGDARADAMSGPMGGRIRDAIQARRMEKLRRQLVMECLDHHPDATDEEVMTYLEEEHARMGIEFNPQEIGEWLKAFLKILELFSVFFRN